MVPSDRLKPVRRVAQSRERDAAKLLGDAQRILQDQESRLEQLRLFQREYRERFETASRTGMSITQLQEYQAFMLKLQRGIEQQEGIVETSRQDRSLKKQHWQKKFTRTQAIGKVIDRFRQEEHKDRERKEQKENDEHARHTCKKR